MAHFNVTISRQFGSLGRPVGMKLAELLGVEFYDRDIVEKAAKEMNLPLYEVGELEETQHKGFFYMSYPLGNSTREIKDKLYEVQSKLILNIAQEQSCVIVGRCSDYLLKDEEGHVNFYIYAPYKARLQNCMEELGMKREEAVKMIAAVDKARNAYHKHYTGHNQEDLDCNHVMIDSSLLGVDQTAELLAEIVRKKFGLSA